MLYEVAAPNNAQKSPARQKCEAAAAQQLESVSQQVFGAAILKQRPHDGIEGAVVGAAAGCAAGAAADTSWTRPGAPGGCGSGVLSGAGWGALWGVNLSFGRAIYDGTAALIN